MIQLNRIPIHGPSEGKELPFWVKVTDEVEPVEFLFTYPDGQGLIEASSLTTLKGAPKSGKSAFGLQLITAALKGEYLGIKASRNDLKVLWVDTEQSRPVFIEKMKAVLEMAGLNTDTHPERLFACSTLRYGAPEERKRRVFDAVREVKPDLVFVDGVVELCEDFNDSKGTKLPDELLSIADAERAAIVGVIHTNKNDDNARGHLGTQMQKNASQTYAVSNSGSIASVVQVLGRFGPRPNIRFTFENNFKIGSAEGLLQQLKANAINDALCTFRSIFKEAETDKINKDDLCERYKLVKACGKRTAEEAIKNAFENFILQKMPRIKGRVYYTLAAPEPEDHEDTEDDI